MSAPPNSSKEKKNLKGFIVSTAYILLGTITGIICIYSHESSGSCPDSWTHRFPFHTDSYSWGDWHLYGHEVWEFYAIIQMLVFSLLILWELDVAKEILNAPSGLKQVKAAVVLIILVPLVAIGSLICLGLHEWTWLYQISLFVILIIFFLLDGKAYLLSRRAHIEFRLLQFYIDIPFLLSLGFLTWYAGVPPDMHITMDSVTSANTSKADFFSGAIAFQFMLGNIAVYFIRSYDRILATRGRKWLWATCNVAVGDLWDWLKERDFVMGWLKPNPAHGSEASAEVAQDQSAGSPPAQEGEDGKAD